MSRTLCNQLRDRSSRPLPSTVPLDRSSRPRFTSVPLDRCASQLRFGMQIALSSLALFLVAGSLLALTLPSRREVLQEAEEIPLEDADLRDEATAPRGAGR